ncbi:MAG: glycine--tRNA ligase [Nanoarchaeota archaeon]|nr:glycine--tRNA ligase [Nanoarchaeota archaeon]
MSKMNMEDLSTFCKKKGFVYQSSEIYGGLSGVYDYGHTGTLLKRSFENVWKKYFLKLNKNFVEIDTGVIMHENVFKASGHLENFFDPIVVIEGSDQTFRADHLIEEKLETRAEELSNEEQEKLIIENKLLGEDQDYSKVKVENLNMMFNVDMGPKKGTKAYLRPETAQSPYVNFKAQFELQRKKLPLGLALIGRVFRNEIAPRNMLLRTREVEQAELQIFFNPNKITEHDEFDQVEDYELKVMLKDKRAVDPIFMKAKDLVEQGLPKFYVFHMVKVQQFYFDVMKVPQENFKLLELNDDEKAFYNKYHFDIEVKMNSTNSWTEVGGIHYRTDHDLKGHQEISKQSMEILDEETREKFVPHVLELSFGLGRNIFTLLDQKVEYSEERKNTLLNLPSIFSPYKVAVLPLVKKDPIGPKAKEIYDELIEEDIQAFYDESGSVGKRYARQDEIGTPYAITIDYETIEEGENQGTLTIRDRDSTNQVRVKVEEVSQIIRNLVRGKIKFEDLQ